MRAWPGAVVVAIAAIALCGCGRRAAAPAPKATSARTGKVVMPEWAPKHPSPAFLRAARVLRPIPEDLMQSAAEANRMSQALLKRYEQWWPAGYEFFGTLTDQQVDRVRKTGLLRLHARDLTAEQRRAFEAFMEAHDRALAGPEHPEYLVMLYKFGAKKDLSNVDVGFGTDARVLLVRTWVMQGGGKSITTGDALATL